MVKTWAAGAVLVVAAAAAVGAQAPRQTDAEEIKARQRISTMEGILERAVSNGADNLFRQVRSVMPDAPMLSGVPEVRGFRLEGYGLFFDVEVPALRMPMAWMMRSMVEEQRAATVALAEIRRKLLELSPREREQLEPAVMKLELQLGASRPATRTSAAAAAGVAAPPPPAAPVDPGVFDNPNEAYTREVKTALVEAMLENSGPLALGNDEWLTVAARDNVPPNPLVPSDTADSTTILFRVKGSDLAALRAGRITLEEAQKRVEAREY